MKDRTPKFPGRVKLKPVAGQTDTYDMTRADDPEDTGTPFNTRTMLQDSTARFLRLPISNPFVDDALRHMPDRIEPIGTVKTSPALSLGDAWLPCDGSQVTFAEYPQLCQLLRGVAGEGVVWDSETLGTTGVDGSITGPVFFNGKWKIAMAKPSTGTGGTATRYIYPIVILNADSLTGPWSVEYTVNKEVNGFIGRVWIAATKEACIVVLNTYQGNSWKLIALYQETGSENWTEIIIRNGFSSEIYGVAANDREFAIAYKYFSAGNNRVKLLHTGTPDVMDSWSESTVLLSTETRYDYISFSHTDGKWILAGATAKNSDSITTTFIAAWADDSTNFQFTRVQSAVTVQSIESGVNGISKAVFYNGKYYTLLDGYVGINSETNNIVLASSTDLINWEFQVIGENTGYTTEWTTQDIAASDKLLVFANRWNTWVSSDPVAKVNKVTMPSGAVADRLIINDDLACGFSASAVAYHDYRTDTRLLPEISLSDDTTTYIKAKNELDVFEAQESGG